MISLMIRLLIRGFGVIAEAIVDSFPEHHRGMVRMVLLSLLLLMIGGAGYAIYNASEKEKGDRQAAVAQLQAISARAASPPPAAPPRRPQPAADPKAKPVARAAAPRPAPPSDPAALDAADALIKSASEKWRGGDFKSSILLAQKALAIRKRELGDDDPKVREVEKMIEAANQKLAAAPASP